MVKCSVCHCSWQKIYVSQNLYSCINKYKSGVWSGYGSDKTKCGSYSGHYPINPGSTTSLYFQKADEREIFLTSSFYKNALMQPWQQRTKEETIWIESTRARASLVHSTHPSNSPTDPLKHKAMDSSENQSLLLSNSSLLKIETDLLFVTHH